MSNQRNFETHNTDIPNSDAPNLGIDLDGTLDEAPSFFRVLTAIWPAKVYIVTYRSDRDKAIEDVEALGVRYDDIILVNSFAEKADVAKKLNIGLFIDDMDEVLCHMPDNVAVLKIRNGGNFDNGLWLYSSKTGRKV